MTLRLPKNYPVKIGDTLEVGNVEYKVIDVSDGFERGVWHKTVLLEHDEPECRACNAYQYCGCPPCPENVARVTLRYAAGMWIQ